MLALTKKLKLGAILSASLLILASFIKTLKDLLRFDGNATEDVRNKSEQLKAAKKKR